MLFGPPIKVDPIDTTFERTEFLLNVYYERVHALFNVLHWPSTLALFNVSNEDDIKIRALKSAILFTSVCSMLDHELEGRRAIVSQYRQRTEEAFIDAGLLTTTSFMVLQAFVVYLVCIQTIYWQHSLRDQQMLIENRLVFELANQVRSNGH
jgi:hypothetical protein